jgi:TRAP-type C4-dicarboxylate transport system permease small subunit
MMLLTIADVFMRYVFARPIVGTTELTEILLVCSLLGLGPCALANGHISVDVITTRLKPKTQRVLQIVNLSAGFLFLVLTMWQSFKAGLYAREYDLRSSLLEVPIFPFHMLIVLSYLFLGITMLVLIFDTAKESGVDR